VASGNQLKIVDLKDRNELVMASETPLPEESPAPRHFVATAADNTTTLHGVMFLPSDFDAARRYPLINYIYPGPQMAWQPQACHSLMPMLARALAEVGFVVIMLDTRGMPMGSREFHQVGYGSVMEPQLSDHAAVIRQLCERHPFIDRSRVGILGQSGGGAAA